MSDDASSMMTDPTRVARRPYALWTYAARGVWLVVQSTLWRLAWRRIDILRPGLLKLFGATVPARFLVGSGVRVHFPWSLTIGANAAISDRVTFYNLGGLRLGNRVVVSQDAYFCGGTHDYTHPHYPLITQAICVEDDVWIGAGAFIGPGVCIGRGAVVGARAVVTRDVPAWKVVAGNPAQIIRDRVMRAP